jgi:hypothetical protein
MAKNEENAHDKDLSTTKTPQGARQMAKPYQGARQSTKSIVVHAFSLCF